MKFLLILVLGFALPPLPKPRLQSPRGAEQHFVVPQAAPATIKIVLNWSANRPLPDPGVLFDVEAAPSPTGPWTKLAAPPFTLVANQSRQYFRVGARRNR